MIAPYDGVVRKVDGVVVVPVGPQDGAVDTIESLIQFANGNIAILALDDSQGRQTTALKNLGEPVTVIQPPPNSTGMRGGLWVRLADAFRYAVEGFDFRVLLRIDSDALAIGPLPWDLALETFARSSTTGVLGAFTISGSGTRRDFTPAKKILQRELGKWQRLYPQNAARWETLNQAYRRARRFGYKLGDHCLGAAYFYRPETLTALSNAGFLELPELASSDASEDHLFGLLTLAVGYQLGEFAGPGHPLGVRWVGLPYAPAELVSRGFRIIHSLKGDHEASLRAYFRAERHHLSGTSVAPTL